MGGVAETPAVVVDGLTKSYGAHLAVDGLSFSVDRGEVFGLLGPNGAGKTTTVETLEGYRKPDDGTVAVLDLDPPLRIGVKEGSRFGPELVPGDHGLIVLSSNRRSSKPGRPGSGMVGG